uniref:Uncharacterized protein n=1 Tax=Acrobeloides nanus TaxID=290746 RepID=A0A914C2A1_9BILA
MMPMYGVLLDEIYFRFGGILPVICNYVPITLGTLQYMIISICSLNRLFVLLGNTGKKKVKMDFYDKLTIFLCIFATIGTFLAYSPITFTTNSSYIDYRINKTYSDDLTIAARYNKDRTREAKLAGAVFIHTLIATGGTFIYASLMYIWPEYILEFLDPM